MHARVDKDTWQKLRMLYPNETDATLSRILFRYSAVRFEYGLENINHQINGMDMKMEYEKKKLNMKRLLRGNNGLY